MLRCAVRWPARPGSLAHAAVGCCLLAGLTGLVAGCGAGGAIAPVQRPAEPALPGREREQVVGRGDTLYSIAWRHGLDYRVLAGANSIRDPYTIHPGQRLLIPESGDVAPPAPEPETGSSEPAAHDDASARGVGATQAPEVLPLPSPAPEPAPPKRPPAGASTEAAPPPVREPASKPVAAPPPKLVAASPPKPPRETPAQPRQPAPEPASTSAPEPPLAARTVGGLRWTRPTRGKTVKRFGRGGNKGIDIEGAFEQPVRAAAPGLVVYAGSGLIGYGKLVIVKHRPRLLSAYAHNERLHVKEGDDVKGGQHIADMGRSGKGRVMLHFEIRRDGKPVDPLRFLP